MKKSIALTIMHFHHLRRKGVEFTKEDVMNCLKGLIACQSDWRTAKPTQEQLDMLFAEIGI